MNVNIDEERQVGYFGNRRRERMTEGVREAEGEKESAR